MAHDSPRDQWKFIDGKKNINNFKKLAIMQRAFYLENLHLYRRHASDFNSYS